MGKDKLDKAVKDKLYDLHTPIDTTDLWQGIQAKMGSDEETPVAGFSFRKYLGLGVLAILLVGSLYLVQDNINTSQSIDKAISESTALDAMEAVNKNNKLNNASANTSTLINNQNMESSTNELNMEQKIEKQTIGQNGNEANNNIEANNTVKSSNNKTTSNTSKTSINNYQDNSQKLKTKLKENQNNTILSRIESKNTPTSNDSARETTSSSSIEKSINERPEKNTSTSISSTNNNGSGGVTNTIFDESGQKENDNNVFPILQQKESIDKDENHLNAQVIKNENNLLLDKLFALDNKVNLNLNTNVIDVCDNIEGDACNPPMLNLRKNVGCYDNWTGDRSKLSILPYVGIDFVTNDQSSAQNEITDYLITRQSTMKFLEVKKAGLMLKYNLSQHLFIKVGAEYDQINEKFETIINSAEEILNPNGVIAYRITMEGDTLAVEGPVFTQVITTTTWRKYNKYHSFNIPIILGYEAPLSKRWDYFAEAGVFYNVKFNYQGTLLDQDNQVVSGENFFLNNTGISLYGGAGVRFNVNKRWSAFTTGSYKYNLASINDLDLNPIKQNLGLAGIAIGAEIRF